MKLKYGPDYRYSIILLFILVVDNTDKIIRPYFMSTCDHIISTDRWLLLLIMTLGL